MTWIGDVKGQHIWHNAIGKFFPSKKRGMLFNFLILSMGMPDYAIISTKYAF